MKTVKKANGLVVKVVNHNGKTVVVGAVWKWGPLFLKQSR